MISLLPFVFLLISATSKQEPLHRRHLLSPFDLNGRKKIPVLFMDADSTLRIAPSKSVSANGPNDYLILPFVPTILKNYPHHLKAIVSNQAGVGHKIVKLRDADAALYNMILDLRGFDATIHYMDYATRNATDRKPGIGMARRIEFLLKAKFGADITIDKENSLMVGDSDWKRGETRPDGSPGLAFSNADRRFAENYGIRFVPAEQFFLWEKFGIKRIDSLDEYLRFAKLLAPSCESIMANLKAASGSADFTLELPPPDHLD